jgi:hypothetical protein
MSMERRFQARLSELLRDAEVPPGLFRDALPRLESFLRPFVAALHRSEQRDNARHYVQGLLSDVGRKNAEAIAYLHDRERQGLQKFLGQAPWDHRPLLAELARQVGEELGEADGVLVFDPSAFPKKGSESVGVQRQWCGRLGKVENCQVGVYLAYVSRREQALADVRLYLPKEWTRRRLKQAGVPRGVRPRTRHELALEMLDERGPLLPHAWVAGDDEMGRCSWFRGELQKRREHYLLAVPSNTLVRDLAAEPPPSGGRGGPSRAWTAGVPLCRKASGRRSRCGTARRGRWWCKPSGRWCRRAPGAGRRAWRSCWWCSASGRPAAVGSTTTCWRTRRWPRRWRSSPGCSRPGTGSRSA